MLTTMRVLNLFLLFSYSQDNNFKEEEILSHRHNYLNFNVYCIVACYATEYAVRIGTWFYYKLNHT
jgi:hypothetical protein